MNRLLIALGLLVAAPSFALGPENWELFGVTKHGKTVTLKYGGFELQEKNKGMDVYVGPKHYGYCEPNAAPDDEYVLLCSTSLGAKPTLIYKKDKNEMETSYYKAAMSICSRYFPNHKKSNPGFGGYYRCIKGCSAEYVDLLVELTYGD